MQLRIEKKIGYSRSDEGQQGEYGRGAQYHYAYLFIFAAAMFVGATLAAIGVYCLCHGINMSWTRGYDPFPIQLLGFVLFLIGGLLVLAQGSVLAPLIYTLF